MIPSNEFTPTPIVSKFEYPYYEPYNPLSQNVLGGIDLNDPSRGRQYQIWNVSYDGLNINVKKQSGPIEFSLPISGVLSVSLAFDNNMGVVLCWTTTTGAVLYYYDTPSSNYITRSFYGITSCRVVVDMADDFYIADSDVIFAYTLNGALYYRQQRDRYDVERFIGATLNKLLRVAPNVGNRLQFQLLDIYNEITYLVYDSFTGTSSLTTHVGEIGTPWTGSPEDYIVQNGTVSTDNILLGDAVFADGSSSFYNGYIEVSFRI